MQVFRIDAGDGKVEGVSFRSIGDRRWKYQDATRCRQTLSNMWIVPDCERTGGEASYPFGDFGSCDLGPYFIVHESALAHAPVADILRADGELLPARIENMTSFVFNPIKFVDVLDRTQSKFVKNDWGLDCRSPVFRRAALKGLNIFRLPERWGSIYIAEPPSGGFKHLYESLTLTGLQFVEQPVSGVRNSQTRRTKDAH